MPTAPRGDDAPRTRRALLSGGIAGIGAIVATIVGRTLPTAAADGDPALLGRTNESTDTTRITRHTNGPTFIADAASAGTAVTGTAQDGVAVQAVTDRGLGVSAMSVTGVAVDARSSDGDAIRIRSGRLRVNGISGLAMIGEGEDRVSVSPRVPFRSGSILVVSPRSPLDGRDLWYEVDRQEREYRIRVSSPASEPIAVAWMLLN